METPELEAPDMSNPEPYVNPKAKDILSREALEQIAATGKKKAVGRKKTPKAHAPTYREPPKGQHKGPIVAGPTDWVVCVICSRLFSTPEDSRRVGTRKRHAAKHLSDHRMGRIKRPKVTKATDARDARRRAKKESRTRAKRAAARARVSA